MSDAAQGRAGGLRIVPLSAGHAERLYPHLADPRLYEFVPQSPPVSVQALAAECARLAAGPPDGRDERWLNWVLFARDEPVGTLQATVRGDGRADVGYVVFASAGGRGHATTACRWLVDRLFEDATVGVVRASVDPRNRASARVAEKVGLRRVATPRDAGGPADSAGPATTEDTSDNAGGDDVYELTREEHLVARRSARRRHERPLDVQPAVERHYGRGGLLEAILGGLRAAGRDPSALRPDDLSPVDAFHIGGRQASEELAEAAGLRPGERVLDVGCGIGGAVRFLASERGCRATGLDLTQEYVETAAALAARVGLDGATRYQRGSALDLPFADGVFDVVWTEHAQMNVADKHRFYAESARVLRPGGRLAFHDIFRGAGGALLCPVPWADEPSVSFLATPDAVRGVLGSLGFTLDVWEDRSAASRAFFEAALARLGSAGPPPVGTHLLMGANATDKLGNCLRNLQQGRIAVVRAVARRG